MRAVIQRVSQASVSVNGKKISQIEAGFLVFIAIKIDDNEDKAHQLAEKISKLRIIPDQNDKLNLSILDTKESLLLVSQFTLYGDLSHGNRPSFANSASKDKALSLFQIIVADLRTLGLKVSVGAFGQKMMVKLVNNGPITMIIDL